SGAKVRSFIGHRAVGDQDLLPLVGTLLEPRLSRQIGEHHVDGRIADGVVGISPPAIAVSEVLLSGNAEETPAAKNRAPVRVGGLRQARSETNGEARKKVVLMILCLAVIVKVDVGNPSVVLVINPHDHDLTALAEAKPVTLRDRPAPPDARAGKSATRISRKKISELFRV